MDTHDATADVHRRLVADLQLTDEDQDMGLINANPRSVGRYLRHFLKRLPDLQSPINYFLYTMAQMIFESVLLRFAEGGELTEDERDWLAEFWRDVRSHHAGAMELDGLRRQANSAETKAECDAAKRLLALLESID